jgi:hypothetical protein
MPDTRQRDQLMRRIIAVLIAVRATTNFGKPFAPGSAFVVFGALRRGLASSVVAPLFGIAMLVYAWGLWQNRPWARPLAVLYAIWATANVVLFPIVEGVPSRWAPWTYSIFAIPGIVIPWLAVWLTRRA